MAKKTKDGGLAEETTSGMKRLGKVNHPVLGACVRVELRHWEGPAFPSAKGKDAFIEVLAPREQGTWGRGKMIGVYNDDATLACVIGSSVSYMDDLRRYGNFRWSRR